MSDVPAGYQRVAALSDVPLGRCLAVELAGDPAVSVVLVRVGDSVFALENRCPHAGAPLSEGFLEEERLTCAWHGWTFDARSGASLDEPDLFVPAFAVRVVDGEVYVSLTPAPSSP